MIEATHLTKRFGPKTAVDDLSFTVAPGTVTGFLGPNGAGKPEPGIRHFLPLCRLPARTTRPPLPGTHLGGCGRVIACPVSPVSGQRARQQ
jgi:hypothetical protein